MDDFRCVVNVTVDGVTEDMFPSVALHKAALEVAKRAGLCPTVQALAGVLRFWARNIPTEDMSATVALFAPGGTTGGGSAYVLPLQRRPARRREDWFRYFRDGRRNSHRIDQRHHPGGSRICGGHG